MRMANTCLSTHQNAIPESISLTMAAGMSEPLPRAWNLVFEALFPLTAFDVYGNGARLPGTSGVLAPYRWRP